jgi:ectoine hydroxylase-related dioxygenase (phytanoyl-CoA dioxygenase family)
MVQLDTFPGRADAADIVAALDRDGAAIVRDLLDPDLLERFRADVVRHAASHRVGSAAPAESVRSFWGERTIRFTRLAARSPSFADILTNPTMLAIADALLLGSCAGYWMNTGQMMILGPGQPAQVLHRDADNWRSMNRPDGFEVTVSCMFAVSDFTAALGGTSVVPGSHRWTDYGRTAVPDEVVAAEMPAGSGLIYTGRVLHGGGANTTDQWRYGLHVSYVLGWLVPEEAVPLGTTWEHVRHLSPTARRLLGWNCYDDSATDGVRLWTVDYEDVPVGLGYES